METIPLIRLPRCIHLGDDTGEVITCNNCSGNVRVKIYECAVHKQCTLGKKIGEVVACTDCGDYRSE